MKKIIKPEDFPIEMNEENIDILAYMLSHFPPLKAWDDIDHLITYEQRNIIRDRIKEIKAIKEKKRWDALSLKEQAKEKRREKEHFDEDPKEFRGNLLQQERDSMALEEIERKKREQQDKEDLDK
jgi:hypothetical protein